MQAILILVHNNFNQVCALTNLLGRAFEIYIHVDSDNQDLFKSLIGEYTANNNVHIYSEVNVHWGSWSIVKAEILLMRHALSNPNVNYLHLISGQDWPIKNVYDIQYFYEEHLDTIYMSYKKAKDEKSNTLEPMIWWQKYYFNYDTVPRRTLFGKIYHRVLLLIQTLFRVNKFRKLGIPLTIYRGSNWIDIPTDVCKYAIDYLYAHKNLLKLFQTGFCSDEFWLQTILCNSDYCSNIINDNYRYIKWKKQNESFPAILDNRDYNDIISSNSFFMRKIDNQFSKSLVLKINYHCNN